MDEQNKKIRIVFTPKADLALEEIIKTFNLEESLEAFEQKLKDNKPSSVVAIDQFSRAFAEGKLSKKDLTDSLQKSLEVSQQIAEQISKEVVEKIIPLLEKIPEEKINDSTFAKNISENFLSANIAPIPSLGEKEDNTDIFPKINPEQVSVKDSSLPPEKISSKIKKVGPPQKKPENQRQKKGPDNYREPID